MSVAPLPENISGSLSHGDEELVITEQLNHLHKESSVPVGNDVELEELILGEHVVFGGDVFAAVVEGLLENVELGRFGLAGAGDCSRARHGGWWSRGLLEVAVVSQGGDGFAAPR